jgi:Ran GTPase-activating protein (RanGAP) involved in mRNA processing and transport
MTPALMPNNSPNELRLLFTSSNLSALRYLSLRLRGFGDAGVEELVASGLIRRLRGLDLCRCEITDDGAAALAACPDVRALEYLHLDNNYLSPVGVEALARVGVTVSGRQWFAGTDPGGEYLA